MGRKPCCDKSGLRQGAWTPEEDRKLKAYVSRYGCWNWRQLPKYAGLARCGKSCRLRWINYLRPNIKRGNYTKEEEETIIRLHESPGNRWSTIAAKLPGRTDNDVKNHWHTTLKKHLKHKPSSVTKDPLLLKTEIELNNHLQVNARITPPLILESSLSSLSSSQPASSDQNSNITTDDTVVSTNVYSVSELFEACEANSGNFWTEPFFSDSYVMSTHHMLLDPPTAGAYEAQFPFLDGELLFPFGFYDHLEGFNF